jgi:redox-sensitive bicupin YhaK (pirin superfamily)
MITVRDRNARGKTHTGWLNSRHSFSFGHYQDPNNMGHGPLRVINEDHVISGAGFGTHPHDNMEIVSYVLNGALEHKDSMGTGSVIHAGDIQRISAGSGVTHSEYNHSKDKGVHFLQIWFHPKERGLTPSYEQKNFSDDDKKGHWKLVMSPDGRDDSMIIHQDVNMYVTILDDNNETLSFKPENRRLQWVQIARGQVSLNGELMKEGDGAYISNEEILSFTNAMGAEIILFDMGMNS